MHHLNHPLPLDARLLEGDIERAGGDWREGEAGWPPLNLSAWQGALWRDGDDSELVIGIGSIIHRMLLVVTLWDDLVEADEVELSCRMWSFGRGLRCHGRDLGSRIGGRSLGLQERSGVARRERPPSLNQLRLMQPLRKWNIHLTRSVTMQRLSEMSPGEAGRPWQGWPAPHSEVWAPVSW